LHLLWKIINKQLTNNNKIKKNKQRCKRRRCSAVVYIGNNIVVLGRYGEQGQLKSVEAFNFKSYTWQELPEMFEGRFWHTAVAV
jgi:hypothetical protein